ncbi:chaperone of endosialidase [Escherichia phage Jahat_MG145]|uniref:Chaperone of endosialidase n=1 Tax=Escherichia phage Jahat_MG145 TaxID=2562601 RepID=A0A4D6DYJ3_9CAUD|nr:chaperone of endosialidase [Escherichia phage Jahat_MG145]
MATVTVIPTDITKLKNDVSTIKQDVSTLKQDVAGKASTTDVDNKLKPYLKQTDLSSELSSGRYSGSFYPLTGNDAFYLFNINTTAQSANLWLDPNAGVSQVLRSTSSSRYKSSVESVIDEYADLMLEMRPVLYRSTCESDRKDWGWYGLIAEEVGEVAPEYVHWRPLQEGEDPAIASSNGMVAEGVMYDRLTVPLIHHVKNLKAENEEMRKEIDELKAVVAALVNKQTTLD